MNVNAPKSDSVQPLRSIMTSIARNEVLLEDDTQRLFNFRLVSSFHNGLSEDVARANHHRVWIVGELVAEDIRDFILCAGEQENVPDQMKSLAKFFEVEQDNSKFRDGFVGHLLGAPVYWVSSEQVAGNMLALVVIAQDPYSNAITFKDAQRCALVKIVGDSDAEIDDDLWIDSDPAPVDLRDMTSDANLKKYPTLRMDGFDIMFGFDNDHIAEDFAVASHDIQRCVMTVEWKEGTDNRLHISIIDGAYPQRVLDALELLRYVRNVFVNLYDGGTEPVRYVEFNGVRFVSQTEKFDGISTSDAKRLYTFGYGIKREMAPASLK